jgi:hypothetical protein
MSAKLGSIKGKCSAANGVRSAPPSPLVANSWPAVTRGPGPGAQDEGDLVDVVLDGGGGDGGAADFDLLPRASAVTSMKSCLRAD